MSLATARRLGTPGRRCALRYGHRTRRFVRALNMSAVLVFVTKTQSTLQVYSIFGDAQPEGA